MNSWLTTRRIGRRAPLGLCALIAAAVCAQQLSLNLVSDFTYEAAAAALLVGALIIIRRQGSGAPASLLIVPLIAVYWRFGAATAPLLFVATTVAHVTRRAGWSTAIGAGAQDVIAFSLAHLFADLFPTATWQLAAFAGAFAGLQSSLRWITTRSGLLSTSDPRAERPDLLLSLAEAPLGAIPVLAERLLGDGGLLLALAALLPVLSVVSEWWKLGVARAEAEAEVKGLERARVLQEELTDLITHEVRNPLTIILGHCQLARESRVAHSPHAGHVEEHLDHIYQAGKTIERLMGNLLQITRVETSDDPEGSEAVDLGMLARDVTAELEPLAEQKGQTIVLDVPEQAPLAQGSPLLLREALTNLVSNAVKYTPEGGQVNVWARSGPAPGTATLGVTDTGIGLSEEDQERLFTKFFRSGDPRVTRERGTGLGLALTHAIVERMGGRIAVESRLNEGATFRVLLPSASGRD